MCTSPAKLDGGDPDEPEAGFYARLSAPGYMDATDWTGPFATEEAALEAVQELYEVDAEGNQLE